MIIIIIIIVSRHNICIYLHCLGERLQNDINAFPNLELIAPSQVHGYEYDNNDNNGSNNKDEDNEARTGRKKHHDNNAYVKESTKKLHPYNIVVE